MKSQKKLGVAVLRVSSKKQSLQGDSPEEQKNRIETRAQELDIKVIHTISIAQSAAHADHQPLQAAIDYCIQNKIGYLLISRIDRFTRAGAGVYQTLKKKLESHGIELLDADKKISHEKMNTLAQYNMTYDWSVTNPTERTELLEAEEAKDERSKILTRTIGASISYTQSGYVVRQPTPGYMNAKVETDQGKRVILVPHPTEAALYKKMFELRAKGIYSDEEIVAQINALGFKTKTQKLHDPNDPKKTVGIRGGKPLIVKQLQRIIENTRYCGILYEKWTHYKAIKGQFSGLVSIDLWNKANQGKNTIIENADGSITYFKGRPPTWQLKKNKHNPLYPYKRYVLCPTCRRNLYASAPKNKFKKSYYYYHCGRNHPTYNIALSDFNTTIKNTILGARFKTEFIQQIADTIIQKWEDKQKHKADDIAQMDEELKRLAVEKQSIIDSFKSLKSPIAIAAMEEELLKVDDKIKSITALKNNQQKEEVDGEVIAAYTKYFLEHLEELLLQSEDPFIKGALFGILFDEKPTYEELKFGTPKFCCLFALNKKALASKTQFVIYRFSPGTAKCR